MEKRRNGQTLLAVCVAIILGGVMAWAGSDGGDRLGGVPVFTLCGALAFAINWLVFVPSALARTERYYDLTGGITYLSVMAVALVLSRELDLRTVMIAVMVIAWALRLSTFLFRRILRDGRDHRFDDVKIRPGRFFMAWTLQGLWALLTAAAALAAITGGTREPLGAVGIVGGVLWAVGLTIEAVADRQKSRFRADPGNKGRFIDVGLWAWSRHPNYFGEIVLWTGVALVAMPVLHGWKWLTLISPVFVTILLTRISGIPLLEKKADERWGGEEDYQDYKRRTPVLIPKPPASRG